MATKKATTLTSDDFRTFLELMPTGASRGRVSRVEKAAYFLFYAFYSRRLGQVPLSPSEALQYKRQVDRELRGQFA